MNNSNFNTFTNWELREEYSKKVYVLTVIPDNRLKFRSSGYSCTWRTFMNEYVCEHALAISIVTKKSRNSIGLDLPVGKQKSRGRPKKAVKGALNYQSKEEAKAIKKSIIESAIAQELELIECEDDLDEGISQKHNLIL